MFRGFREYQVLGTDLVCNDCFTLKAKNSGFGASNGYRINMKVVRIHKMNATAKNTIHNKSGKSTKKMQRQKGNPQRAPQAT